MICPRCYYPFAKVQQVDDLNRKAGDVWCDACDTIVSRAPSLFDAERVSSHSVATSVDAAKIANHRFGAKLMAVLQIYIHAGSVGLTDEEMADLTELGSNTHRGCRIKLENMDLVRRTNLTRITKTGHQARVFVAIQFWNGSNAAPASAYKRRSARCRHCGKLL